MRKFYLSRYLAVIDIEGQALLFSGASGNMDVVSGRFAKKLRAALAGSGTVDFLSPAEADFFLGRGYLTQSPPQQERLEFSKKVAALHAKNMAAASRSAQLTLLLNYDCNLSCGYCYQKDIRGQKRGTVMPGDLLDLALKKHYGVLFPGVKPYDLRLSFYGGEPFLPQNLPAIERVLAFSAESGARVSAISNCSRIECVAPLLGPLPGYISNVQVTLDAGGYKGAALQRAAGGKFNKIISNIHMMLDKKVTVSIRMHVIDGNYAALRDTIDYLASQEIVGHPYCFPHLAPIRDYTTKDPAKLTQHVDFSHPVAREISARLGYPLNSKSWNMKALFSRSGPRLTSTYHCMHNSPNSFILDPYGDLYGCTVESGREQYRVGKLGPGGVRFFGNLKRNLSRDLTAIEECLDCPYALLCGGSCAYNARILHGDIFAPDCADHREAYAEAIRFTFLANRMAREKKSPL